MNNVIRRSFLLSTLLSLCFAALQVALVVVVVFTYREIINRRVGVVSLAVQSALVEDEVEMGRTWPEIATRLQERFNPIANDDEMAFYDATGHLLARSGSHLASVPPLLSDEIRARLDGGRVIPVDLPRPFGTVISGGRRTIGGQRIYMIRINATFHNTGPWLLRIGLLAIVLPMLLLGLGGALAVARLANRQVGKVDRVLRIMAGGDLSARLSLPVDRETASIVLSFNRMAEKVERTVEKLRRSDESRRQLLADVTHELNTPLTSVLGYLETLTMDDMPLSPERRLDLTKIAHEEAVNLRALIEDLTTLSRLDAEGLPIEKNRVDLGHVVEQAVRRASHKAEGKGVPLLTDLRPRIEVLGDAHRLGQVVRNLVENALRHTSPPGDVTVAVFAKDSYSVIEVRDRGAGISPKDLPRLGQRFLRLDRSRARHTGGRGLGLSISYGLIEAHGGTMRFESELGKGTTVRVTLPAAPPPAEDTKPMAMLPALGESGEVIDADALMGSDRGRA